MSDFTFRQLNPGSPEAREVGCTCSVRDNRGGAGCLSIHDEPQFIRSDFCPLHGRVVTTPEEVFINGAFHLVWRLPIAFLEKQEDRDHILETCEGCFLLQGAYDWSCCHVPCFSDDKRLDLYCNEEAPVVEYILVTTPPKIN